MTFEEKVDLVERAAWLQELWGPDYAPRREGGRTDDEVESLLDRWCTIASKGDPKAFRRRLAHAGLDRSTAARQLRGVVWRGGDLPPWVDVVERALRGIADLEGMPPAQLLERMDDPASGGALVCLMEEGRRLLASKASPEVTLCLAPGMAALEDGLRRGLRFLFASPLREEVLLVRLQLKFAGRGPTPGSDADCERALIQDGILARLLTSHAALARLCGEFVVRWCDTVAEMGERIAAEVSNGGVFDGGLRALRVGLSDPHAGNRTVSWLELATGAQLAYKPRRVGMASHVAGFVAWLRDEGLPLSLPVADVLSRPGYGFMGWVPPTQCASLDALAGYCRSAGAWVCLAYIFEANDLHDDNLLATEAGPVIVDFETWLSARPAPLRSTSELSLFFRGSVLSTNLLPMWFIGPGEEAADVSGLGSLFGPVQTSWYERAPEADPVGPGLRLELDSPEAADVFTPLREALVSGFETTYEFLRQRRDTLLASGGPLEGAGAFVARTVLRSTGAYARLLSRSVDSRALMDGVARGMVLEELWRPARRWPDHLDTSEVRAAEIRALLGIDIPRFEAHAGETTLRSADGSSIEGLIAESALTACRRKLRGMGDADLQAQCGLIRHSVEARLGRRHAGGPPPWAATERSTERPASPSELLRWSEELAQAVVSARLPREGGLGGWLAPHWQPGSGCFTLGPASLSLSDGRLGAALLFAALAKVGAGSPWRQRANDEVASIRTDLEALAGSQLIPGRASRRLADGAAGLVYGLTLLGTLLGEESPLALARRVASSLLPTALEIPDLSLYGGRAGIAVAIAAIHAACPSPEFGAALHGLAGQLRTALVEGSDVAGLGEGTAGLWLALSVTGEPELELSDSSVGLELASDALRSPGYCRGLAGLAASALVRQRRTGRAEPGLERLAERLHDADDAGLDTLCCGRLGTAAVLGELSREFERPALEARAHALAARAVRGAGSGLHFQLMDGVGPCAHTPGFLSGTAGIGYALLALARPDEVPSPVLWSPVESAGGRGIADPLRPG